MFKAQDQVGDLFFLFDFIMGAYLVCSSLFSLIDEAKSIKKHPRFFNSNRLIYFGIFYRQSVDIIISKEEMVDSRRI